MVREGEERQARNTVDFGDSAQGDEKRRPAILLLLGEVIGEQDAG